MTTGTRTAVKVLHAADVHLDAPLRGLAQYEGAPVDEMRGATRRAFSTLVDLAIDETVGLVVVAGDLFDGAGRDYNTALFFNAEATRLRIAGIPLVLASGNHDADAGLSGKLRSPDNVTVLPITRPKSVTFDEIGIAVHGQGFSKRDLYDNLASAYPAPVSGLFNIGVLHTSINGRPGHEGYAPCTVDELRGRGYDYWALGHVHTREIVCDDPWIVYPGCLQGRHAKETGAKGATLVEIDDGRVVNVEHRDLDVVRWAELAIDITGMDEDGLLEAARDAIASAVGEAGRRVLATRVVLTGATPAHRALVGERDRLVNELRSTLGDASAGLAWLEKLIVKTSAPTDVTQLAGRDDALGALARTLRTLPDDETALNELWEQLAGFRRKLPPEISEEIGLTEPAGLTWALADVEHLLLPRLAGVND